MRIPPNDPTKPRRLRRRLLEPLALSDAGTWYVKRISPKVDPLLAHVLGGRLSSMPGVPVVLLKHTGAKSGQERVTPLLYFTTGEEVVLIASNYGRSRHPAWLANVRANPEVRLRARGREGRYVARVAQGEERERLWALAKRYTGVYGSYEQKAGREIQVVVCRPLDRA
jgi:deazaflavin-dependent oxidoreductase (nitroreductase family)